MPNKYTQNMITLNGCFGSGTNHVRLLLGLRPGGEIRDLRGRRVEHDRKLWTVRTQIYTPARAHQGPPLPHWGRGSYWLRMEFLTRELYTDSRISHERLHRFPRPWVRFQATDPEEVALMYLAKSPDLAGRFTWGEWLAKVRQWQSAVPGATHTIDCHHLFQRHYWRTGLPSLTRDLGVAAVDPQWAREVHLTWCDLNEQVLARPDPQ